MIAKLSRLFYCQPASYVNSGIQDYLQDES